jgi:hypothetical protein
MMRYIATTCMILASISAAATQMTHEETVVRANYAKFAYATRLGVLVHYVQTARSITPNGLHTPADIAKEMAEAVPNFEFGSFAVGNNTDIAGTGWDTFVSKPNGDLINTTTQQLPYRMKTSTGDSTTNMNFLSVSWDRHQDYNADWSMPAQKVLEEFSHPDAASDAIFTRYAAYTVTVKLNGRQRTYQAIFLFGKHPDGTEAVWPIDHILGMGSLSYVTSKSIYPQPLLETHLREWPGISAWIATASINSDSPAPDVVCDGVSSKCGIPAKVLQKALQVPIDPESRRFVPVEAPPLDLDHNIASPGSITNCTQANTTGVYSPMPTISGNADHNTGSHSVSQNLSTSCSYTGGAGLPYCDTGCSISQYLVNVVSENGETTSGNCHVVGSNVANGNGQATNGGANCSANMTGGAIECSSPVCSKCTITINAGLVSGTGTTIMSQTGTYPDNCNPVNDPTTLTSITISPANVTGYLGGANDNQQFTATGNYSGGSTQNNTDNATWTSSDENVATIDSTGYGTLVGVGTTTITATIKNISGNTSYTGVEGAGGGNGSGGVNCSDPGGGSGGQYGISGGGGGSGVGCPSPIIIDTTGEGFHLTSAENGVFFDFFGNGKPIKMSWTARGSHNAFLALERNGKIDSGKDLFGNITPQPPSPTPNGYLALAVYDKPENGGNGDGVIDARDAIFPHLLLWIDENHNGIAEPNELHHLPDLGVLSLGLSYQTKPYVDKYGNHFRYKGVVNPEGAPPNDHVDRQDYDVFFVAAPHPVLQGGVDGLNAVGVK